MKNKTYEIKLFIYFNKSLLHVVNLDNTLYAFYNNNLRKKTAE